MAKLFSLLDGKKTYLLAITGGIYWVLIHLGYVADDPKVWELIGVGAAATIRAAIGK